ncbi:MAG: CRTAC1 family protein, partial [Tunicatimonas sp.]
SLFLPGMDNGQEERVREYLALAHLRLGEQQNCIHHHASSSCIIPISEEAQHHLPQGSTRAAQLYQELLNDDPRNRNAQWLLNVAMMTTGDYPHRVPIKYQIPDSAFRSDYPLKRFTDVAHTANLDYRGLAGSSIVDDFNNDGWLDVVISEWHPRGQLRYFINQTNGRFEEQTESAQLLGITGGSNLVQADYDNDGYLDIFVTRGSWLYEHGGHPNSLLRNNGDGTFTDVTEETGLLSFHPTQTATWNDFNQDGWLDLFIGNETAADGRVHPSELYLNNGDGPDGHVTFREQAQTAGVAANEGSNDFYVKGVTSGDYNNDGWPDIYVSVFHSQRSNILFKNEGLDQNGQLRFSNVTQEAGLLEDHSSFPTWFWDYDNDGWLDIFVAGYFRSNYYGSVAQDIVAEYLNEPHQAATARLYRNNQDGTFSNVSKKVGLDKILYAMGANFGDLDNDGWLDMYLSTGEVNLGSIIPNRMFRNAQGTHFQDVTTAGGFGHLQKGHGVSFADYDNDGDQDVYVVMGGAYEGDVFQNALFQNPYENENHWVGFVLQGTTSNRSAIGSRVMITFDEQGKERQVYREVNSGGSFGCSPLRLEVGVGKAMDIKKIEIIWNGSQKTQQWNNVPADHYYLIVEGDTALTHLETTSLPSHSASLP